MVLTCLAGVLLIIFGFWGNYNNKRQNIQILLTAFGIIVFAAGLWNSILSILSQLPGLLMK